MTVPLVATRERLTALWTQLAAFPLLRAQLEMDTPVKMLAAVESPRHIFLDVAEGHALVLATDIHPRRDATVWFAAWDHDLAGKRQDFLEALDYLFRLGQLARVTMLVPHDMRILVKLARRLGFSWEGVLRRGWQGGDLHINGLLREELDASARHAA